MNGSDAVVPLAVVGCDFRIASSCWRSRLVLDDQEAVSIARGLRRNLAADGFLDLNTCNRNEWIVSSSEPRWAAELLRAQMIKRAGEGSRGWLEPYAYTGVEAARHVFRVAIGQESLVVGERQIARQLYRALELSRERGLSSRVLNGMGTVAGRLVRVALRRGCIENAAIGVHSLAVSFLGDRLGVEPDRRVAVIGLGRIGRRVLGQVEDGRRYRAVLCTRTVPEGQFAVVRPIGDLGRVLAEVDAAVVCTGALQPVVGAEHLVDRPDDRPLLIIDIGIPEQVTRRCQRRNVHIAGLDDLVTFYRRRCGTANEGSRAAEVESLVETALAEFALFCGEPRFTAILDTVQRHHRKLVGEEIPRLIAERFSYLPDEARTRLTFDLKSIVLGYTSEIFRTIKEAAAPGPGEETCTRES